MKCIKCGYESKNDMDAFCQNCGHAFDSNYCTNDNCLQRNNGEPIPCPEDACFCPDCGAETTYFQQGVVSPKTYNQ